MIYVFIGTKAQYIKTAPLLRLLAAEGLEHRLIDSGQHAEFSVDLRRELEVREPDVSLGGSHNISTVPQAAWWMFRLLLMAIFRPRHVRRTIFRDGPGICVVHGDTPSTFLATVMAKRAGLQVAHIEAGLRSFTLFRPFPEELIRILCMRWSDILFSPSEWATENLRRMAIRGQIVQLDQNTNFEAMQHAMATTQPDPDLPTRHCLMTVHRVETILNRRRLRFAVELAEQIAETRPVVFVLHPPTERQLIEHDLLDRLRRHPHISTAGLMSHGQFLHLMSRADFVITDGGSIQEESYYLDVPCLVLRSETERTEGLGGNVMLANFDSDQIGLFLETHQSLRHGETLTAQTPSQTILDVLRARA